MKHYYHNIICLQ